MNNKKGFTLMELLAVIVLLGLLISLASVSVLTIRKKMNNNLLNTKIKMIEAAAKLYGEDHNLTGCEEVLISTLVTNDYLDYDDGSNVKNPVDNTSMNDKNVKIYIEFNQIIAKYDESCPSS